MVIFVALWVVAAMPSEEQPAGEHHVQLRADTTQPVRQHSRGVTLYRPAQARAGGILLVEVDTASWCSAPAITWMRRWRPTRPATVADVADLDEGPHAMRVGNETDLWRALLPVPLGAAGGPNLLRVHCGREEIGFSVPVWRDTFPETELRVAPKYTRKPPLRVAVESKRIQEAWGQSHSGWYWDEPFMAPVPTATTSVFGTQRVFNGKLESRHLGVDLDGRVGTPIVAANSGRVVLTANNFFYTGNAVFIDHGDQLFSVYFHLSEIDVWQGQLVKRGQRLGAMGKTGRVTGPHLHFGIKLDGIYVDPFDVIGLALEPTLSRQVNR